MIKNELISYLRKISLLSFFILAVYYIFVLFTKSIPLSGVFGITVIFFFAVNLLVYYFLLKAFTEKFSKFSSTFMIVTFLKLMVFIGVLIIYVYYNPIKPLPYIGEYLTLYIIFTIFEVRSLLEVSKRLRK